MVKRNRLKNISLLEQRIRIIRLVAFDFDGVFTDNMVYVFENGLEAVRCFRSDGRFRHFGSLLSTSQAGAFSHPTEYALLDRRNRASYKRIKKIFQNRNNRQANKK